MSTLILTSDENTKVTAASAVLDDGLGFGASYLGSEIFPGASIYPTLPAATKNIAKAGFLSTLIAALRGALGGGQWDNSGTLTTTSGTALTIVTISPTNNKISTYEILWQVVKVDSPSDRNIALYNVTVGVVDGTLTTDATSFIHGSGAGSGSNYALSFEGSGATLLVKGRSDGTDNTNHKVSYRLMQEL